MLKKILKFAVTGALGTVSNLVLFAIFADFFKFQPHFVSVFCFLIACTQNYIINHIWTFKVENGNEKLSFILWAKFLAGSLAGFAVNFAIFSILIHFYDWTFIFNQKEIELKVIPQGIGIFAGMILNFIFSNFIVFKKESSNEQ